MAEPRKLKPKPKPLGPAGRAIVAQLESEYDFSTAPQNQALLEQIGKVADMIQRLSDVVGSSESLRCPETTGRGAVAIPELVELRYHRTQYAALLKALALPVDEEETDSGVMSRSEVGRVGARARWVQRRA